MTLDQAIAVRAAQLAGKSVERALLARAIEVIRSMPKPDTKQPRQKYKPKVVKPVAANPWGLSGREREVLAAMAEGEVAESIATRLGIAPTTVHTHVHRARGRMRQQTAIGTVVAWDRHARHHADGETMIGNP